MTHDDATKLLPLLAVSELDEELRAAVTQHVALCPDCAAELHDLTAACALLRAAMDASAEPRLSLAPSRYSALMAAAAADVGPVAVDAESLAAPSAAAPKVEGATPTATTAPTTTVGAIDGEAQPLEEATPAVLAGKPSKQSRSTKSGATAPSSLGGRLSSLRRRRPKGGGAQRLVTTLAALFVVGLGLALVAGLSLARSRYSLPAGQGSAAVGNDAQYVMGAAEPSVMDRETASQEVFESLDRDGTAAGEAPGRVEYTFSQDSPIIFKSAEPQSSKERERDLVMAELGKVTRNTYEATSGRMGGSINSVMKETERNRKPEETTTTSSRPVIEMPTSLALDESRQMPKPKVVPAPSTTPSVQPAPTTLHAVEEAQSERLKNVVMNDGHAEGARPDASKRSAPIDFADEDSGGGGAGGIAEKKREVAKNEGEKDAYRSDVDRSELRGATESSVVGSGSTSVSGKLAPDAPKTPAMPGMSDELAIGDQLAQNGRDAGWSVQNRARVGGDLNGASEEFREAGASWFEIDKQSGGRDGVVTLTLGGEQRENRVAMEDLRLRYERREAASPEESPADDASEVETKKGYVAPFTVDATMDLSTQYNWRGVPVADEPVAGPPNVTHSYEGFSLNGWANYDFSVDPGATASYSAAVPGPTVSANDPPAGAQTYQVKRGDSLWAIAQASGVTVEQLKEVNGLTTNTIQPGQKLIIPNDAPSARESQVAASTLQTPAQIEQSLAARRAAALLASLPKGTARVPHQVTGGETVEDIAMMYGADPEWVVAANPLLLNGGPLEPGTTIQVPMPPVVERYAPSQEAEGLPPAPKKAAPPVNPFVMTAADRLSTFALEADTASYTLSRRYIQSGYCPPKAVVRMEEFINAFDYNYPTQAENTFNIYASAAQSPFRPDLTLLKVGVKAKVVGRDGRKPSHLIFVVDASGSMATDDRLPLVKHALSLLLGQLDGSDRVSIVTYGTQGTLLREATSVEQRPDLVRTIQGIQPGTSTNMVEGIELAYQVAQRNYQAGEINRIILCSDGIANVGAQTAEQILELVSNRRKQGITFTSVGVGAGAYDDQMLEQLANRGDGNYVYIDSREQARKVFVDEFSATLQTVAKDAKIQVDFDPKRVRRYRLIGYENRDIADADFRNDSVDAGEINSGQSATALYELELLPTPPGEVPGDLGTVFVRYQNVDTEQVEEIATRLTADLGPRVSQPSTDPYFLLAASAAEFAEHLRGSEYAQGSTLPDIQRVLSKVLAQLPGNTQATGLQELTIRADGLPEYR